MSAIRVPSVPSRSLLALAVLFGLQWTALAVSPRHRQDWALENVLSVAFVAALAVSYRRLILSRMSYTAIFLFLSLHTIGAHYTYSEVPYDAWARALTGHAVNELFGWERNHFDRFAHFAYGVLLAYPIQELLVRGARIRGIAFLGTQGDVWDTQKDMAFAVVGALLSMTLLAIASAWRRCDVARRRPQSRRVRHA